MHRQGWWATKGEMNTEATGTHVHHDHQILVATEGLMLFEDANHRHVLSGSNAAWIPAGCVHQGETMGRRVAFLSLHLSQEAYDRATNGKGQTPPSDLVIFSIESLWLHCLERLCCGEPSQQDEEIERAVLRLALLLLSERWKHRQPLVLPRGRTMEARALLLWLEQHFAKPITLADLARHLHASERTVQRIFTQGVGMGFGAYLTLRRIFAAALLLSTSEQPIGAVALEVGYESLGAFYGAFQRVMGMTPRVYQRGVGRGGEGTSETGLDHR